MTEIWKDIDGYKGYQVSNIGRVRTYNKTTYTDLRGVRHWKNRILKPKISKKDRISRVELWSDGKHKTYTVHRLVAITFLGKPKDKALTVNHKDGNRLNNCVENLEWLTIGDNIRHAFENDLISTQKHVVLYNEECRISFRSMSQASRFLERNNSYISNCIKLNRNITDKHGKIYLIEKRS